VTTPAGRAASGTARLFYAAVLLAIGAGWGLTQPLGKIATSAGHQPFGLVFWQLVIGAVLLGAIALARGQGLARHPEALRFYLVVALFGTLLPGFTFYSAIARLPSSVMALVISTLPLLAFPLSLAFGIERFAWARLLGLILGLAGVALIAAPGGSVLPDAALAIWLPVAILGPMFYAIEGVYVARNGTAGLDAVQAMFGASLVGAVLCLPVALATGQFIDPLRPWTTAEFALVASATVNTVVYAAYVWLIARAGAVFAGQVAYLVTATGVLWAMAILAERPAPALWAAMALMLAGVALVRPRASG
jgi:drug/metabolite transporter (DMT)-like permease